MNDSAVYILAFGFLMCGGAWRNWRCAKAFRKRESDLSTRWNGIERMLEFAQSVHSAKNTDGILNHLGTTLGTEFSLAAVNICHVSSTGGASHMIRWPDIAPNEPVTGCACRIPFRIGPTSSVTVQLVSHDDHPLSDESRRLIHGYINGARVALRALEYINRLEEQSLTDSLTRLYNRRALQPMLKRELALVERHGQALSVVMIDIDYFKQINDTLGHAAGDELLRKLAEMMRNTMRKTDLAFRAGGDEFVLVLPHTNLFAAQQAVNHLRDAVSTLELVQPVPKLGRHPTLSIGLTERNASSAPITTTELLATADRALYEAKAAQRNCVRVSTAA